ncbi:MAG: ATP:corrinoid adenosyltransferase [Halorubrum sp. J07HR59]|jgi:cob(I)yrinic acid a,c-diamide adenosyltransferase (EC 2.5.1.17)|nr:MAG: ATP:corrinoid adenosyltransferase [Halorubrum sp. J07HR59]
MVDTEDGNETDGNTNGAGGTDATAEETDQLTQTPGGGERPAAEPIEPSAPEQFGLVSAWWGNGKGKSTAAMGMGFRAAGHGFRVHMLQFMKGGASSVEATRGEYNAITAIPGFSYENGGHYGWHGLLDGSDDDEHAAQAQGALNRAEELLTAAEEADLSAPIPLDTEPEAGMHMLIIDEILYAANRDLIEPAAVVDLVESKPEGLELVLTGGHEEPEYILEQADLISHVNKEKHPFDSGQRARLGTEY